MTANAWIQLILFLVVVLACVKPLGWYMARVYQGQPCGLDRALGWVEREQRPAEPQHGRQAHLKHLIHQPPHLITLCWRKRC